MQRSLGARFAYYRFFYVVVSIVTFVPVLFFQLTIDSPLLWAWPPPLRILQMIGIAVSLLLFAFAGRQYDQPFFFGLSQIREHRTGKSAQFSGFIATGILRRMRHPYYSAGILLLLCWGDITYANLIMKVVGIVYFIVGAILEERKLVSEFGEEYRRYQREVPMFLPRVGKRGKA